MWRSFRKVETRQVAKRERPKEAQEKHTSLPPARRFTDGAGGRVEEKRAVVGFAVVVARSAKAQRANENQQCWRERPPAMLRVDERRIKGREIRSPGIVGIFEGAERGVSAKTAEHNNHREDLHPPGVAAQGAAETRFRQRSWNTSHSMTSGVGVA